MNARRCFYNNRVKPKCECYISASAEASFSEMVAYFATPTMVKTFLKCGVRPKTPMVR